MLLFPTNFVRALDRLPCNIFAKQPRLVSYDRYHQGPQPNCIADDVLREAEICELLRQNPHPNIAEYIGCQVADGKITSICFAKYDQTLMQVVNLQNCGKKYFGQTEKGWKVIFMFYSLKCKGRARQEESMAACHARTYSSSIISSSWPSSDDELPFSSSHSFNHALTNSTSALCA